AVEVESVQAPDDFFPRRYRAVSVPLSLDEAEIEAVLEDDFGAPAPTSWRLFNWNGEEYEEYPTFGAGFTPGAAYLLVTQGGARFDVENARSTRTDRPMAISLHPGWNLVGNPFAFPVAWSNVEGDIASVAARAYFDGTEMIQSGEEIGVLRPWDGLFVSNASASDITLLIPPIEAESGALGASAVANAARTARVTLSTIDGRLRDSQNWISLDSDVSLEKAPVSLTGFQLSIADGEMRFARRGGTVVNGETRWTVIVRVPPEIRGSTVTLDVQPGADWPQDVVLSAYGTSTTQALARSGNRFSVPVDRSEVEVVLVLSDSRRESDHPPNAFTLSQNYPNPFNPSTEIGYTTPKESLVSVEVYDALGRLVKSLVHQVLAAGIHHVAWDGTDASGVDVPGGVYFYRATLGDVTRTRSMVLIR
ncbi:MAG TPA: FlgD immunoglobulin-like domain containing protein, partial [Rhodothermales bacterium]|nr:FlgD immunoglobulin-like domain containing protein [Rhodothermales bacterium]